MKSSNTIFVLALAILLRGGLVPLSLANEPSAPPSPAESVSRPLADGELKELLTAALQHDYVRDLGELELKLTRPWSPVTVPDKNITLRVVELPTQGVTPSFIVRFELRDGDTVIGNWQMPVQARVWREVQVARTPLRRGESLVNADKVMERRDMLALRDGLLPADVDESRLELAEGVPAGTPLLARHVKPRKVISRGQLLDAVVQNGAMTISLKVEALEDGAYGQQVRVRNAQSKREFRGKVEDERTILVDL